MLVHTRFIPVVLDTVRMFVRRPYTVHRDIHQVVEHYEKITISYIQLPSSTPMDEDEDPHNRS